MRRRAALLVLLLATGCGLPLAHGVREPGAVPAEQRQGGDVQVVPPGPRDDAAADEIVRDFFRAQGSPGAAHASAREFLAPELRRQWRDTGPVRIVGPSGLDVQVLAGASGLVRVRGTVVAQIGTDGAYTPAHRPLDFEVRLRTAARGRWVITDVPAGLVLSGADRERSFRARNVYFLAPPPSPGAAPTHLVPDREFLPVTADAAQALVQRLLAGPSAALGDSVQTAFPAGTRIRAVHADASGLVTVDLSEQVGKAPRAQQDLMSAQLVWTLREIGSDFSHLRLLSAGRPIGGVGNSVVQDASDWSQYDPDGPPSSPRLYYVAGRRLRVLDPGSGPMSAATSGQPVDLGAASPRGGGLALVTRTRTGYELRTGPLAGPFTLRAQAALLTYPTWGSGEEGVWLLESGRVVLAPLSGRLQQVPVDGIAAYGPITGLRVARDGVRVALIAGVGQRARLLVGRVVVRDGARRIVGLQAIPGLNAVRDLTWDSPTSLVVLGTAYNVSAPVRATVDGSSVTLANIVGLEQKKPDSLTAGPQLPLVVAARDEANVPGLYVDSGHQIYVQQKGIVGAAPFYPG